MNDLQRKYLVSLAAEAATNVTLAEAISARGWRMIMLAICEDMGVRPDAYLVVDCLLDEMGILSLPQES